MGSWGRRPAAAGPCRSIPAGAAAKEAALIGNKE